MNLKTAFRVLLIGWIGLVTLAPTHDYQIENQPRTLFRQDLNNVLSAIVQLNVSSTEPTAKFPNMFWADTTSNQLKKRNNANTLWVVIGDLDVSQLGHIEDTTGTVTSNNILDLTVNTGDLASDGVTLSKHAHGTADRVIGYNASGVPVEKQVGTNDLAANVVTLPKMATGTQGGIIYYGASGAPTELPPGTAGQVLESQGSGANPTWGGSQHGFEVFTSSGTWTKPSSVSTVRVMAIGGGGGGASGDAGGGPGGGGGGEFVEAVVSVSGNITVTVGAAGTAGSNSAGGNGGDTTFGSLVTAKGGTGGEFSTGANGGAGGTGGSVTGDALSFWDGLSGAAPTTAGGDGGLSGKMALSISSSKTPPAGGNGSAAPGTAGSDPGDGGGGGDTVLGAGGAGGPGILIVMY